MKYVISIFLASVLSASVFAQETSQIKTATGQTLSVGDTLAEMEKRLGQSPNSMTTRDWNQGKKTFIASDYTYEIEGTMYIITVVQEKIKKIDRVSTTP